VARKQQKGGHVVAQRIKYRDIRSEKKRESALFFVFRIDQFLIVYASLVGKVGDWLRYKIHLLRLLPSVRCRHAAGRWCCSDVSVPGSPAHHVVRIGRRRDGLAFRDGIRFARARRHPTEDLLSRPIGQLVYSTSKCKCKCKCKCKFSSNLKN
jgi:hypothetical protein